jgi:LmeA-like phospholipid-binding
MRHTFRFSPFAIMLCGLLITSLACAVSVEGPTPPGAPIPVSTEAAGQLTDLWKNAVANPTDGQVSIVVTETQLTSFLAAQLAEAQDTVITNPQVYLRDNKIQIYGTAKAASVTTTVSAAFSTTVSEQGSLQLQVASANFGPVALPTDLLARLSIMLNDGLTGSLSDLAVGIKIINANISDGQMTIVGELAPK